MTPYIFQGGLGSGSSPSTNAANQDENEDKRHAITATSSQNCECAPLSAFTAHNFQRPRSVQLLKKNANPEDVLEPAVSTAPGCEEHSPGPQWIQTRIRKTADEITLESGSSSPLGTATRLSC